MLFILKYNMISEIIRYGLIEHKRITTVFLSSIGYLYFCLARGTNLEIFEMLVVVFFVYSYAERRDRSKKRGEQIFVILLALLCYVLFINRISQRGVSVHWEMDGFVFGGDTYTNRLFPIVSSMVTFLYSYFGFGMIFFNKMICKMWSDHILHSGLVPQGLLLITGQNLRTYMAPIISVNARFVPDVANLISSVGVVMTFFIVFSIGRLSNINNSFYRHRSLLSYYIINYFVLLQMISLPVGNFVVASSSSILIVFYAVLRDWLKGRTIHLKNYLVSQDCKNLQNYESNCDLSNIKG